MKRLYYQKVKNNNCLYIDLNSIRKYLYTYYNKYNNYWFMSNGLTIGYSGGNPIIHRIHEIYNHNQNIYLIDKNNLKHYLKDLE